MSRHYSGGSYPLMIFLIIFILVMIIDDDETPTPTPKHTPIPQHERVHVIPDGDVELHCTGHRDYHHHPECDLLRKSPGKGQNNVDLMGEWGDNYFNDR